MEPGNGPAGTVGERCLEQKQQGSRLVPRWLGVEGKLCHPCAVLNDHMGIDSMFQVWVGRLTVHLAGPCTTTHAVWLLSTSSLHLFP